MKRAGPPLTRTLHGHLFSIKQVSAPVHGLARDAVEHARHRGNMIVIETIVMGINELLAQFAPYDLCSLLRVCKKTLRIAQHTESHRILQQSFFDQCTTLDLQNQITA